MVGYTKDPMDDKEAEKMARHMCIANDMIIGFSTWCINKYDILNKIAPYAISHAHKVGSILMKSMNDNTNPIEELAKEVLIKEIGKGIIVKIEMHVEGGFDYGTTWIEDDGVIYSIDLKMKIYLLRRMIK